MKIRVCCFSIVLTLGGLFGLASCATSDTSTSTQSAAPVTRPNDTITPAPATPYMPSGYGARRY